MSKRVVWGDAAVGEKKKETGGESGHWVQGRRWGTFPGGGILLEALLDAVYFAGSKLGCWGEDAPLLTSHL